MRQWGAPRATAAATVKALTKMKLTATTKTKVRNELPSDV